MLHLGGRGLVNYFIFFHISNLIQLILVNILLILVNFYDVVHFINLLGSCFGTPLILGHICVVVTPNGNEWGIIYWFAH